MDIILFIEYIGIASAALSGFLFGVKKGCDWLGLFIMLVIIKKSKKGTNLCLFFISFEEF